MVGAKNECSIDSKMFNKNQNNRPLSQTSDLSDEARIIVDVSTISISASADGGPRSRVCARETLRSAPH